MRTKEIQNTMIYSNKALWEGANPHSSESKEGCQLNDEHKGNISQSFIKSEGGDAASWSPFLANFSVHNEDESRGSSGAECYSELSRQPIVGKKVQNSLDSVNKCRDSSKTICAPEMDVKPCSNKSILVFDTLDCRKGMTEVNHKNDQSTNSIPDSWNTVKYGSTGGGYEVEHFMSYRSTGLSFDVSTANDDGSVYGPVNAQISSKSQQRNNLAQYPSIFHVPVNSVQRHESNSRTDAKNVADVSRNDPLVGSKLPQENGTQRIFRSFLTSFGDEGNKDNQLSLEIPTGISGCEDGKPTTSVAGLPEDEHGGGPEQFSSKDRKTLDVFFPDEVFQLASSGQAKHDTVPNQEKYDVGESSFSKASLVTFNEPMPHPGNISMRSDGSISGRSFAFPIIQSEWNSSPVKMAKADRRHYRKNSGWGSGIFCCRF